MLRFLVLRLALLFTLLPFTGHAVTYYVSASGSDSNSGTSSSQAWRTIDRVNQVSPQMQPGDKILFQRGGEYRGKLSLYASGTTGSRIEVSAYGSGADPVISGSVTLSGWTQHSGNIWRANISRVPKQLYFNGQLMTIARFPNTGWLRADGGTSTSLADSDLNQSTGYWNGATAVIRTTQWSYDTARVSTSTPGNLIHSSTGNALQEEGWGYFLRNKLSLLDAPGEWFYEASTGRVYLWCPDGGSPTNDLVEGAVEDNAIYFAYQRHDIYVNGIAMRHQIHASLRMSGSVNIEVANCTVTDTYHGMYATGSAMNIHDCTFQRTYATGLWLLGATTVSNCTISDIALHPGLGENDWGYFGIRTSANNIVIRDNHIDNIGYIGIVTGQNSLIERNVVTNCTKTLNDGGAIALDGSNGLIIRDNIVKDHVGNFESIPEHHHNAFSLSHGIYFGNTSMMNTLVQNNTVSNCDGNGIGVDHTMVSTGNQIKDNVLFGNRTQMGFTDYSNYNGPGATPPYYVPSYNTVISGNVMYCTKEDQLCMDQMNVYQGPWVDFGTFSNNRYFNPYNELSILIYSLNTTERKYYSLERWQTEFNEDAGSTRCPVTFNAYDVLAELSANLVPNSTFGSSINYWDGWPNEGVLTHAPGQLDNGALKVHFNNNNTFDYHVLSPDPTSNITNGAWYRMTFSAVGTQHGELGAGFKGWSQQGSTNMVYTRQFPLSTVRRDITLFFQSDLTDNGNVEIRNHYTEGDFWIDNVNLHKVQVAPRDPVLDNILVYNDQLTTQNVALPSGTWKDVNGTTYTGTVSLQAFRSKALYRTGTGGTSGGTLAGKVYLDGPMNWGTTTMNTTLKTQGLVPQTEPYTGLGLAVSNPGATAVASIWSATGSQKIVDWIYMELRSSDGAYSVVERRAALVRANGDIVDANGNAQVTFNASPVGKHIVVGHRNHLPIMTTGIVSQSGQTIDFTTQTWVLYGQNATLINAGKRALWPGDVNMDNTVRYAGSSNDRDPILDAVGGSVPTGSASGYRQEDVNMDGLVIYSGSGNDRDRILTVIGGSVPTAVRAAQIP